MKRILFLFVACVAVFACTSKEQKMSEELLKGSLKAPSTYKFISFEQDSIWTMGSELSDRIELYKGLIDSDKRAIVMFEDLVEDAKADLKDCERERRIYGSSWDKFVISSRERLVECENHVAEYKSKLEKDQSILDTFVKLQETEDLSQETGKIYVLTYEAQNTFGVPLKGVFRTHFKSNGELVEYKSEDEKWVVIGDVFSIPGYYDLIGKAKEEE